MSQEVRLRAVPPHADLQPYLAQLAVELIQTDTPRDGGGSGQPELIGNVEVSVKNDRIAIEVVRVDEAWTGPVEVIVR